MRLQAKYVSLFMAWLFLLFGVAYTVYPVGMFASSGDTLSSAASITDVRAVYGGLEIAIALYLLYLCHIKKDFMSALQLLMLVFCSLLFSRSIGLLLDEGPQFFNYAVSVLESLCLLAVALSYRSSAKTTQHRS